MRLPVIIFRTFLFLWLAGFLAATGTSTTQSAELPKSEANWRHDAWGLADGLPDNSAERLLRTRDGWLWIGTRSGLARFDGHTFTVYDQSTPGFASEAILDLAEDDDGSLWIATKRGLYRKQGERFHRFATTNGLLSDVVLDLCPVPGGGVWIATQRGLNRYKDEKISSFPRQIAAEEMQLDSEVATSALGVAASGPTGVWVGSASGLHHLDLEKGWQMNLPSVPIVPHLEDRTRLRLPFVDSKGAVWVASDFELLRELPRPKTAFQFSTEPGDIRVRRIVEIEDGGFWLVRAGQVYRFNRDQLVPFPLPFSIGDAYVTDLVPGLENEFWISTRHAGLHRILPKPIKLYTSRDGLPHHIVTTVAPSRLGGVWVGTQRGFRRFDGGQFIRPDIGFSQSDFPVRCLMEDSSTNLWLGTGEGWPGLDPLWNTLHLRRSGDVYESLITWPGALVTVWYQDSSGRIWEGTRDQLACFAAQPQIANAVDALGAPLLDGHPARRKQVVGAWEYAGRSITRYFGTNALWMARRRTDGLNGPGWSMEFQRMQEVNLPAEPFAESPLPPDQPLASYDVRAITETADGSLWFGTWGGGLHRLREGRITHWSTRDGLPTNQINTLLVDGDKTLWIGTPAGLVRATGIGGSAAPSGSLKFDTLSSSNGLPSRAVYQLLEDGIGHFWIGSEKGIYRVSRSQVMARLAGSSITPLDHLVYDAEDGLFAGAVASHPQPSACRTSDGLLWFASSSGLVCIDPKFCESKPNRPTVLMDAVIARGKKYSLYDSKLAEQSQIDLPPESGYGIDFRYAALVRGPSDKLRFRYRLFGPEARWVEVGSRRSANFSHLEVGLHRFEVQVSGADGVWSEPPAGITFRINPTPWQRNAKSFWAVALFLCLAACGWALQVYLRLKRHAQLEAVLTEERQRISQELHDQLSSDITRMSWLCAKIDSDPESGRKLAELARQVAASLLGITSVLRHRNESLEQMVESMCQYAEQFLQGAGLELELDVPSNMPARVVSATLHQAVYLSVREALLNVHKHANATKVIIKIVLDESCDEVRLTISDNGVGLSPRAKASSANVEQDNPSSSAVPSGGAGLVGMKNRMEQIGGSFSCRFGQATGTIVQLIFATPRIPKDLKNQSKP